jgi:glyoxylase-like metal-dependent hydrolase (beta-lactamase superfamily II)
MKNKLFKSLTGFLSVVALLTITPNSIKAQTKKTFLPLPQNSKPIPEGQKGYRLEKFMENGYAVISGVTQGYFIITTDGVVILDAPASLTEKLPKAIKEVTDKPVTYAFLTHDHADHIGGITAFPNVKIICHQRTVDLFNVYPKGKPKVWKTFEGDKFSITIGGEKFDLIYPGANHETGNIIVYMPNHKVAMMADLFAPGWGPYLAWGNADHIPGLIKSYNAILALDFDVFIAGHAYRLGNRHDVEVSRALWIDLWTWTKETMATTPFDTSVAEEGNLWAMQSVWFDAIADKVAPRLIEKYGKDVAAVDAFVHDCVKNVVVSTFTDDPQFPENTLSK